MTCVLKVLELKMIKNLMFIKAHCVYHQAQSKQWRSSFKSQTPYAVACYPNLLVQKQTQ